MALLLLLLLLVWWFAETGGTATSGNIIIMWNHRWGLPGEATPCLLLRQPRVEMFPCC
jgi:hypothetical protein